MYGQVLYLLFLQHAIFDGDTAWFVAMWRAMPSEFGADPDYQDALDGLLAPRGLSFLDSVPRYARWLAYAGETDDGAHFPRGALYPDMLRRPVVVDAATTVTVSPMVLGSAYVSLTAVGKTSASVALDNTLPADVDIVVQRVPGVASDGDVLTLPATVPAGVELVVTVMPTGSYDVDDRTDAAVDVRLSFTAAP